MADAPRCPLGFSGTPPLGHPSIPGFGGGGSGSGAGAGAAAAGGGKAGSGSGSGSGTGAGTRVVDTLAAYRPSTLLIVDALFLGLCIIAAIYRDDIKALWVARAPSSAAALKNSAAGGSGAAKVR